MFLLVHLFVTGRFFVKGNRSLLGAIAVPASDFRATRGRNWVTQRQRYQKRATGGYWTLGQ
jgi:hypothetical protein